MVYLITPPSEISEVKTVLLPASKSIGNRVLLIHALANSSANLANVSDCNDTNAMVAALRDNPEVVDVGAAGTAMRFLTAYYAMKEGESHVLTGTKRMQERPIAPLVDTLREMGAEIEYLGKEGFPPMRVTGHCLSGGAVEIPGNISSQYISALLMIAPYMEKPLELGLSGEIASRPYIDMTIKLMKNFGADVAWSSSSSILCKQKPYQVEDYTVEADWSAASYWFEIMAISSINGNKFPNILLPGLKYPSLQGDADTLKLMTKALNVVTFRHEDNCLMPPAEKPHTSLLRGNFTNIPDLAQTMVVLCCMLDIPFVFYGLESLYIKETDRIGALCNELYRLGYDLYEDGRGTLMWQRGKHRRKVKPVIQTYEDHRMAMAFAPCCLKFGEIRIAHPEVVSKSYPGFWDDLRSVGFNIQEIEDE